MSGKYLRVDKNGHVGEVVMCRPKQLNTVGDAFFEDLKLAVDMVNKDDEIRVALFRAEGRLFTAGLDLKGEALLGSTDSSRVAESARVFKIIKKWQGAITAMEESPKPFIALVHNHCIGGGIDMICATDFRLCTKDAKFSIQETKIAITADIGTLQRIEKVCHKGFARQAAFTGGRFDAAQAEKSGFVNSVYDTQEEMLKAGRALALEISKNSPRAVQGTKICLNYAENHSTADALNQMAFFNTSFLDKEDIATAVTAFMTKQEAQFRSKL
eukprot:CAMPEP_0201489678 /NCGR_PEP_ID=MMETSP0151_2-20130828/23300_1 /ASSEMBLY_ACC=CAM_ASM_000257 /TAXON_ID=200890 /ORGANISM="Paramoeba atlantica, Strain 621/1 / CCAP 1560/9" /LENGTH=270 /DNA_ID=CAMNT_0047875355 /DNA_START=30 /DNA_END=842 /DNA_ORIENTATION=+